MGYQPFMAGPSLPSAGLGAPQPQQQGKGFPIGRGAPAFQSSLADSVTSLNLSQGSAAKPAAELRSSATPPAARVGPCVVQRCAPSWSSLADPAGLLQTTSCSWRLLRLSLHRSSSSATPAAAS